MDRPKCEASWLESFPPDIWAYFAEYLAVEHIGRLMMTGATLLSKRLKSPKVVKSVTLGHDDPFFKSFPRFLNDFPSLEKLTIKSLSDRESDFLGLTIESIPSGVRNLDLQGRFGDELFLQNGSILKMNEHLPHLEIVNFRYTKLTNHSWMVHSPHSLTKVNLYHWHGDVELPSSLIDFEAANVYLSTNSFVSKLPPSLENFVVSNCLRGVELILPLLPPSIRKLSMGGYETDYSSPNAESPTTFLKLLPRALTCLSVPGGVNLNIDFVENPELICLLPQSLTKLRLDPTLPCSSWSLLPQRLTDLTLGNSVPMGAGFGEPYPFEALPRTLIKFGMIGPFGDRYFCNPSTKPDVSYLPPSLTNLHIPSAQFSPDAAKLLPRSLTHLAMGNLCGRVCQHLPRGLTRLISWSTLLSPTLIKSLPRSITDLSLELPYAEDPWFDPNTGKKLDSLSEHPDYPIHEQSLSNRVDWDDTCLLPPNLTTLHVTNAATLGDLFFLHQPLLKLTDLAFMHSQQLSDLCVPLLPRNITHLDLWDMSNITGKSFGFLPLGLTLLKINHSKSIFDCDIRHLPRTLTHLEMKRAIHLTDLCIPDLPPSLGYLSLKLNTLITPACVPSMPIAMKSSPCRSCMTLKNFYVQDGEVHYTR